MRDSVKCLLILIMLTSSSSHAVNRGDKGAWKIAIDEEFMPFTYADEHGDVSGLYVEMIKAVLDRAQISYELLDYPWKRLVYLTDRNDVVFSIPWREKPERFEKYFMIGPLSSSKTVFFSRTGEDVSYHSLDDLSGFSVGMIDGFAYPNEFEEAKNIEKVKISGSGRQLINMLINKRFDLLIGDKNVILAEAKKSGLQSFISVVRGPELFDDVERYAAFNKENKAEAMRFQKALKVFANSQECKDIFKKYASHLTD